MDDGQQVSTEAKRQMSERGRKQWLSAHVSKGKAFTALGQAYHWLLGKRRHDKILGYPEWAEPFHADRPGGLITRAEGIRLMLQTLRMNREISGLNLLISEEEAKNELRWELLQLLNQIDERYELRRHFAGQADVAEQLIGDASLDPEQAFLALYRAKRADLERRAYYPGTPYLTGEMERKVNYTDTAATVLNCLVEAIAWNEIRVDAEMHERVRENVVRAWTWLRDNRRECVGGGCGWGWAGLAAAGHGDSNRREDEVKAVAGLDADRCMPQTFYTSQALSALVRLHRLLSTQSGDAGLVLPHLVQLPIEAAHVAALIEQGVAGLLATNRPTTRLGWLDVAPYASSRTGRNTDFVIQPEGHDRNRPTVLHTAYACSALADVVLISHGQLKLSPAAIQAVGSGMSFVLDELQKLSSFNVLKTHPEHRHVLSRTVSGEPVTYEDECCIYSIFKGIASYVRLCDVHGAAGLTPLTDEQRDPMYRLARFILEDLRDRMYDTRGFPAIGHLGRRDIDRFPAVRATSAAVLAFEHFGLHQMVPGIDEIVEKHLTQAREEIILELVARYSTLEEGGIRVAWGLIEQDGQNLRANRERSAALVSDE